MLVVHKVNDTNVGTNFLQMIKRYLCSKA